MSNTATARAFAPATVGNIICGFDIFGLALGEPGDEVETRRRGEPGVVISAVHGDGGPRSRWQPSTRVGLERTIEREPYIADVAHALLRILR